MGCDPEMVVDVKVKVGVLIHAPIWGATHFTAQAFNSILVSIHAPVGVRHVPRWRRSRRRGFNPRTRVGCDIRTLAEWMPRTRFNSRTRVGCDVVASTVQGVKDMFQSTHPCGVRPLTARASFLYSWFQSTHPCGVRLSNGFEIV